MKNVYRISPLETMADAIDFLQRLGAGEPFEDDRNQDDVRAKKKKEKKRKTYGSSRNQLCCCLSTHFGHNFAKIQHSKRFRFQESLVQQNEPDTNHFYLRSSSTERGLNEVIQIS